MTVLIVFIINYLNNNYINHGNIASDYWLYGGFPEMGVPLNYAHIFMAFSMIFHEINHPAMGVPPMTLETPGTLWRKK